MNEALKPCPFCGALSLGIGTFSEEVIGAHGAMHRSQIHCLDCDIIFIANNVMPFTTDNMRQELVIRWNNRVKQK